MSNDAVLHPFINNFSGYLAGIRLNVSDDAVGPRDCALELDKEFVIPFLDDSSRFCDHDDTQALHPLITVQRVWLAS